MTSSRIVIVAGAGIGGLTAALALARNGFRVVVLEQAERLEETGAGIQLSPNATRMLIDLGLGDRLRPHVVAPPALRVLDGRERPRNRAHAARRRRRAALRRALLGRSIAAICRRRSPPRSRRSSTSRSSSACAWRISPPIPTASPCRRSGRRRPVERARPCADRRRRAVVGRRARVWALANRRALPAAPPGAR